MTIYIQISLEAVTQTLVMQLYEWYLFIMKTKKMVSIVHTWQEHETHIY